jgi:hypothetical protein
MKLAQYSISLFLEGAGKQQEALQANKVVQDLHRASLPCLYPEERLQHRREDSDLSIEGCDRLCVGEIAGELDELSAARSRSSRSTRQRTRTAIPRRSGSTEVWGDLPDAGTSSNERTLLREAHDPAVGDRLA